MLENKELTESNKLPKVKEEERKNCFKNLIE